MVRVFLVREPNDEAKGTMKEFIDTLRNVFPDTREPQQGIHEMESVPGNGASLLVRVTEEEAHRSVTVQARFPDSGVDYPAGRSSFNNAVVALVDEHWSLGLRQDDREERLVLTLEDEDSVSGALRDLADAIRHLEALLQDIVGGTPPFEALGKRDVLVGEEPQPTTLAPPAAIPAQAEEHSDAPEAAVEEPAADGGWEAISLAGPFVAILRVDQETNQLHFVTSSDAADEAQLQSGIERALSRRLDISLVVSQDPASLLRSAAAPVLKSSVAFHASHSPESFTAIRVFLERTRDLLAGGMPFDSVLGTTQSSGGAPTVSVRSDSSESRTPSGSEPERSRPRPAPAGPSASKLEDGDFDVYLTHVGYNAPRVRQVLSLLLSVDVIAAQELCDAVPCLLVPNVPKARAVELENLLWRAGAKLKIVPPGQGI